MGRCRLVVQVVVPARDVREEIRRLLESAEIRLIDDETGAASRPSDIVVIGDDGMSDEWLGDAGSVVLEEPLTARELEVLNLLADGLSNKGIGARLDISEHTAKFHVASVLAKLGAANRADAVRRGVRRGLVIV